METKIIFGPPGTGKTTRLLAILEKELENYSRDQIAFVSYTREGVKQGKDRAIAKFGGVQDDYPYFRTLHSLAFHCLGMKSSGIVSKRHYRIFSKKMGMNFTGYYTEDLRHNDDRYLFVNDLHRNNPKATKYYMDELDIKKYQFVKHNFKRYKEFTKLYDFTDMIQMFVDEGKAVPVKVAIIDEAQDLTTLQWQMVWTAFKECDRIYIAGDDDQAIYQWAGADVEYFLKLNGTVEILNKSYRLPDNILRVAKSITSNISNRIEKEYSSNGTMGEVYYTNNMADIKVTPNESWLFLARNNKHTKDISKILSNNGIPHKVKGKKILNEQKINAIRVYELARKTRILSDENEKFLRPHVDGKYSFKFPWYVSFKWDEDEKLLYRDYFKHKLRIPDYEVNVNTIHSVKGAEADNVVVILDISKTVYRNLELNPDSEHRVFYVGVTRAKKKLYIVYSSSAHEYKLQKVGGR